MDREDSDRTGQMPRLTWVVTELKKAKSLDLSRSGKIDSVSIERKKDSLVLRDAKRVSLSFFLSILSRSNFDHHLRCGGSLVLF